MIALSLPVDEGTNRLFASFRGSELLYVSVRHSRVPVETAGIERSQRGALLSR
jgi:hypothetical protein